MTANDALIILGIALIIAGAWWASPPLALVIIGLIIAGFGVVRAR